MGVVVDGVAYRPTQRATQKLDHGTIIWEIDNSNIIRFVTPQDKSEAAPSIKFVGEGLTTYQIKMIYQPSPNSFPCLISNPRFTLQVFWDDDAKEFLATPAHVAEMNRSSEWLVEGVRTMNALHQFWNGTQETKETSDAGSNDLDTSERTQANVSWSDRIAAMAGTFAGAFGRVYFS